MSSAPATRISLEFGIDNLVAVGVVHAENKLTPQLEQQVAEIQRLGTEIQTRTIELQTIYDKTSPDEGFKEDCQAFIELAQKAGHAYLGRGDQERLQPGYLQVPGHRSVPRRHVDGP